MNTSSVRPSPFIRVLPTAAEASVPDARFIMRHPGHPEFRSIICLLTEEQIVELALDDEMSAQLSTWKSIMQQINNNEVVSQASLDWLSRHAKGFMRLIKAKLGYVFLKSLSDRVFSHTDVLLLNGWPVEIPGSGEADIVTIQKPETDEDQPDTEELYWVGPSLMYRPEGRNGNSYDGHSGGPGGGGRGDDGDDSEDDNGDPGDDDGHSIASQQNYSQIERLPAELFGNPVDDQQTHVGHGAVAFSDWHHTDLGAPAAAPDEDDDDEHGQPKTGDHMAVSHVSRHVARPSTGGLHYDKTDHIPDTNRTTKRKRDSDVGENLRLSRKKRAHRGDRQDRVEYHREKEPIEFPGDGPDRGVGRCLTCIRYKRKCPIADGIVGGKCWVCRGSPEGRVHGTQQRNCYWLHRRKRIDTYAKAQRYHNGRTIPQNTRAAIKKRQAAYQEEHDNENEYEHEAEEMVEEPSTRESSSSFASSAAASVRDAAETQMLPMTHIAQFQAPTWSHPGFFAHPRFVSLARIWGNISKEHRIFMQNAISITMERGLFGPDSMANMQQLVTGLIDMQAQLHTADAMGQRPRAESLTAIGDLVRWFRAWLNEGLGLDLTDIQSSLFNIPRPP